MYRESSQLGCNVDQKDRLSLGFRFFMSIQNGFADFLEESPVDVAQLTTFSEHIPDEWVAKAAALSDKATIH